MSRPSPEVLRAFKQGFLGRVCYTLQEVESLTGIPITRLRSLKLSGRLSVCRITPRRHVILAEDLAFLTGALGVRLEDALEGRPTLTVQEIIQATGISLRTWDRLILSGELQVLSSGRNASRRCTRRVLIDFLRDRRDT